MKSSKSSRAQVTLNSATPNGDDSSHLSIRPWIRIIMYSVCLLPIAMMSWALLRQAQLSDGNMSVALVICIAVMTPYTWLFTRLYSLCSIDMNSKGVEQSFVLLRGGLVKRVHLRWDQVQHVSFARFSYHFVGADGLKMELNTALFGDANATISAVRLILPQRLLSQLDSAGYSDVTGQT